MFKPAQLCNKPTHELGCPGLINASNQGQPNSMPQIKGKAH
jgi:hypothetical protein